MHDTFLVYCDYVALKQHFSKPGYDYFKYNGKMRLKPSSFNGRKDKLFFQKLAKRVDYKDFLIANLSVNEKAWIRDLAYSEQAEKIYSDWQKRQQSLSYVFKQELGKLEEPFDSNLLCEDNEHPYLLRLYLSNEISLETICILLDLTKAYKHWDDKLKYDPLWDSISLKIKKYMPFIKYDKEKIKKIVVDKFNH